MGPGHQPLALQLPAPSVLNAASQALRTVTGTLCMAVQYMWLGLSAPKDTDRPVALPAFVAGPQASRHVQGASSLSWTTGKQPARALALLGSQTASWTGLSAALELLWRQQGWVSGVTAALAEPSPSAAFQAFLVAWSCLRFPDHPW